MNKIKYYFEKAAKIAEPTCESDYIKSFWLGCIGIRSDDGVIVQAKNLASVPNDDDYGLKKPVGKKIKPYKKHYSSHSEIRCLKKMNKFGGILYVARISKAAFLKNEIEYMMARPCSMCESYIQSKKVHLVYYTISNLQYGVYYPEQNKDRVFRFSMDFQNDLHSQEEIQ